MKRPKLPVGIENFQEIRQADFYYVDKTRLIEQTDRSVGESKSFYKTSAFWENIEYEYASLFLRDRGR